MTAFEDILNMLQAKKITCLEAASMLGASQSTFYRMRQRYQEEGIEGLADRRLGKASARRAPVDEVMRVINLYKTEYYDYTVKHFHEKLTGYGINRSYTWTKNTLQSAGLVKKAPRRGAHRRKRARKPLPGMMLHQDGSTHQWIPGQYWDLIVTLDDATNETYSAFFVEEEGTMSSFQGIQEVIEKKGLFCSLYVDRGSHYWRTQEAGGKVDKENPTQVKRALDQLGIELIPAYSPEARGRSERAFGTHQKRLPQELRRRGISTIDAANQFLREEYLPDHNKRFTVEPEEEGSAFVPWIGPGLEDFLCVQEERVVTNDNTVLYKGQRLQIPEAKHRYHYVKAKVKVCEYPSGKLAIFHGPRRLATFDANGEATPEMEAA